MGGGTRVRSGETKGIKTNGGQKNERRKKKGGKKAGVATKDASLRKSRARKAVKGPRNKKRDGNT